MIYNKFDCKALTSKSLKIDPRGGRLILKPGKGHGPLYQPLVHHWKEMTISLGTAPIQTT